MGISKKPVTVIQWAAAGIQRLMDIAEHCIPESKLAEIALTVLAGKMPELDLLSRAREEVLYNIVVAIS